MANENTFAAEAAEKSTTVLERVLEVTFTANSINAIFFFVLLGLFIAALYPPMVSKFKKLPAVAPNLLTAIGVLGTFLGIFIALQNFADRGTISDESMDLLLSGMTTAFITSIWGIFFSVVFRLIRATEKRISPTEHALGMVESIKDTLTNLNTRTEENHAEMRQEFKNFADKVVQSSTDGIVEALEKIMRDFNTIISDKLGESFEQFKIAVENLLQWQENYKTHLETMEGQLQKYTDSLASVDATLASIRENTDAIPEAMEKLPEIVNTATETLEAFAKMKEQALEAFPTIEANLEKVNTAFEQQLNIFENTLAAQQASHEELRAAFAGLGNSTQEIAERFNKEMQQSIETILAAHRASIEGLTTSFAKLGESAQGMAQEMVRQFSQTIEESIKEVTGEIKKAFKENSDNFDEFMRDEVRTTIANLQEELRRVMSEMGVFLTSLSKQFVDDYEPLTESLRRILDTARELNELLDTAKNNSEEE